MAHRNKRTIGSGNQIDELVVALGKFLFQNDHRENRGTGRHVAGTLGYAVGRNHAGSCITFRGTERNAGLKSSTGVE